MKRGKGTGRLAGKPAGSARKSLHRSVAQDIGARILSGEFAPGDVLPNEAEWGQEFGVSRTAVREAIKTLMGKGLIVSRPRIGSKVLPREQWNLLDRDVLAWHCASARQADFLSDMQQLREILEPETAALAATNRTEAQMRTIDEAFGKMQAARTLAAWNKADVVFHQAILVAAGNELLVPLGLVVESALGAMFEQTASQRVDIGRTLPEHDRIRKAIAGKRPDAARAAVKQLLGQTRGIVDRLIATDNRRAKAANR